MVGGPFGDHPPPLFFIMTIKLPEGYRPPSGAEPGDPFEVVAVLAATEDGSFTIRTIDGVKLEDTGGPEMDPDDLEPEQPSPFEFPEYADPQTSTF